MSEERNERCIDWRIKMLEVGTKAPEICPICAHPKAYFEIKAENY